MRAVTSIICVLACTAACSESPDAPATLSRPAAGAAALAASSSAGVTAIDLGTLGGTTSEALAINALGHVVGYSLRTDNVQVGALWDGGWHPLDQPAGATSAYAHGVNSGDVVVGIATISGASQAVEW